MKDCIKKTNEEFIDSIKKLIAWINWVYVFGGIIFMGESIIIVEFLEAIFPIPGPLLGFSVALGVIAFLAIQFVYAVILYDNCKPTEDDVE